MTIPWLIDVLRAAGLQVVEEGNWRSRTVSGSFAPIGVLWHHTVFVSSPAKPAPGVSTCINGRSDLQGPLCHALIDYNGVFHLISAGKANHAGPARASGPIPAGEGNAMLIGWEIDYGGQEPQPEMTSAQYDAAVRGTAAVLRKLGRDASYVRGHRETSTTGKIDPNGVDLNVMRTDVAAALAGNWNSPSQLVGAVDVVTRGDRYDVFARAADNRLLQWSYVDRSWHGPTDLGGPIISAPAVTVDSTGRFDVFVVGSDHTLIHRIFNGSWQPWEHLGGVLHHGVSAVSRDGGRFDVFSVDTDHHLVQKIYSGGKWSSWIDLGGVLTAAPSVVYADGRYDVFSTDTDQHLVQKVNAGSGWSSWNDLGGYLTSAPSVTRRGSRYDVFATDSDHHLVTKAYNGSSWTGWSDLGGLLTVGPAAVNPTAGRYDILAANTDHRLVQKIYDGEWHGWSTIASNRIAG